MKATNRQRKLLRLYGIPNLEKVTIEDASELISHLRDADENLKTWDRYVFLTGDFDRDSDDLKPFNRSDLEAVEIPPGWNRDREEKRVNDKLVAEIVAKGGPFDSPLPKIEWEGRVFVFSGRFDSGSKKSCADEVVSRGALVDSDLTLSADYLIVGAKGNSQYSEGSYGEKVKAAIIFRGEHGKPAVIPESYWVECLSLPAGA